MGGARRSHSSCWNPAERRWEHLESIQAGGLLLADPHGSRYPALFGWSGAEAVARRFDPNTRAWGPVSQVPRPGGTSTGGFGVDSTGDAHTVWRDGQANYGSRWPVDQSDWEPRAAFEEVYTLAVGSAHAFMWADLNGLRVRRFDRLQAKWSDPVFLPQPVKPLSGMRHLAVAKEGSALLASLRRDGDQVIVEAWHYDAAADAWGDRETVMAVPTFDRPDTLIGPIQALSHARQDLIWAPAVAADGVIETHFARYDPIRRTWAEARVLRCTGFPWDPQVGLSMDDDGRVFGQCNSVGLLRLAPGASDWAELPNDLRFKVWTSAKTAFAVAWSREGPLVGWKSVEGADWVAAKVFPRIYRGAHLLQLTVTPAAAGPGRGLVIWKEDTGTDTGLWAAFVE